MCVFIWNMLENAGSISSAEVDSNLEFVVTEIFNTNHEKFKQNKRSDTWCKTWDDSHEGYVEHEIIYQSSKRVGIMDR